MCIGEFSLGGCAAVSLNRSAWCFQGRASSSLLEAVASEPEPEGAAAASGGAAGGGVGHGAARVVYTRLPAVVVAICADRHPLSALLQLNALNANGFGPGGVSVSNSIAL